MPRSFRSHFCTVLRRVWPAGRVAGLAGLLSLLLLGQAHATHIVGGEMDLQYLSLDSYQLTLTLYFDDVKGSPGARDEVLTAGIFEKGTGRRMTNLDLPLVSDTYVQYTNPACAVGSLRTRQLLYRANITLPSVIYSNGQGYYAAVERCCRNVAISNIVDPGDAAQTFYLEFPAVIRNGQPFRDSTPRIFPPLADYACLGELFYYDFGGNDPDGDSLVYDLVTPLNGHASTANPKPAAPAPAPYGPVVWQTGLSATNQIPGQPTLTVDAYTGRLQVRPTRQGLFVFGVRCQEFRRGVRIGETRRDFQLQVLVCPRNQPPALVVEPTLHSHHAYQPNRDTLHLTATSERCIRLLFTDPDPSTKLTLSLHPVNYTGTLPSFTTATTGTVHTAGQPDTLVATLCFPDCLDSKGQVNYLDLIVADNGCALPKRDTVRVAYTAVPGATHPPTLTTTAGPDLPLHVRPGQTLTFDVLATDPDGDGLSLGLAGSAGFEPAGLGATLALQPQVGTQRQGRFSWLVPCAAITDPPGQVRNLVLSAASTSACAMVEQAPLVTLPVVVDYGNQPPTLSTSFPADSAGNEVLLRLPLGEAYTATLTGLDPDPNDLVLSATGDGFDLAAAGMRFTTTPSPTGQAAATFTWLPSCGGVSVLNGEANELRVTFRLQETTCQPRPQLRTVRFQVQKPGQESVRPPNIITPNGDDKNQEFTMANLPADFCDFQFQGIKIFSRWGQEVFSSTDRGFRWAGQGSNATYYYLITYTGGHKYKGWLEVVP